MIRSVTFCVNRRVLFIIYCLFVLNAYSFAQNPIVTENANTGVPISEWGVPDFRDNRIAGFATKMSLNNGETVRFKINVQSGATYTLKIYRIGYYSGNGARLMSNLGTFTGTVQPAGISDAATGLLDCSNWSESATWAIPANAVSGFYIAKIERTGGGSNHIVFIVRNDASHSDLYLQIPDATWQAYNGYGGNSNYDGSTAWSSGHAVKVSYNRPFFPYNSLFNTDGREADWYMNAEYPMIRWLERNGYDITYTSCNDVAKNGSRLLNHKVFVAVGHDEYWSKQMRDNVEAARSAGVHLAFFTGNEVYWKTRWENNDGTEDRTLVCYKEGLLADGSLGERVCGNKCDPSSEWTGLWRTGGSYDAGKPENSLLGQISWVEYPSEIAVPFNYKKLRFWRNSAVANLTTGQTASLGSNTLGYEWDYEQPAFAAFNPAGRITMSSKTINSMTHKLSLYRHASGALVFGAGTIQWSWGLDGAHWGGTTTVSPEMQQATVNLFADMGVQPGTLQSGLTAASKSTDLTAPTATITSPTNGTVFANGAVIGFSGTAVDNGGGVVGAVEISTNGGATWSQATFTNADASIAWTYSFTAGTNATYNVLVRGVDDSGNIGTAVSITVIAGSGGDTTPPSVQSVSPANSATSVSITTGITATLSEAVNSSTVTTGTFQLRDAGNNLVSATVSTSSNQITLTPSAALTGNTVYTATITGGASGVKDPAGNALATNYTWSFTTVSTGDVTPPTVSSVVPLNGATGVNIYTAITADFSEAINASTVTNSTFVLRDAGNNVVSASVATSGNQIRLTPTAALNISTAYSLTIVSGASGVKDLAGNALANNYTWSFTTGSETSPPPLSIQTVATKTGTGANTNALTGVPAGALLVLATTADANPMDATVSSSPALTWTKRSDAGASQSDNAEIWTAVFAAGGSINVVSNWGGDHSQTSVVYVVLNAESVLGGASATAVSQAAPSVAITTTRGNSIIFGCTADFNVVNGATRTIRDAATERLYFRDGNYTTYHYTKAAASIGTYTEGISAPGGQKSSTALLEIRTTATPADIIPPTISSVAPANAATGIAVGTTVSATFSEAIGSASVTTGTFQLRDAGNNLVTATVSTSGSQITLTPSSPLTGLTVYTATITGGASGVKDIAGNALAANYSWSFTTLDNTAPTVSSISPSSGANGVSVGVNVTAVFSEAINESTVTGSTFQLRDAGNNLVTATISSSGNQITLVPSSPLNGSTIYTATITGGSSGVKDLAGNALAGNYSWSFTTLDNIAPTVIVVSPSNAVTEVSIGSITTATFSEAINSSTVTTASFELRDAGNNLVIAAVTSSSNQITLTPLAPLANSTLYTATIIGGESGVKDNSGNSLAANYSWSFTTAAADLTAPTVNSVSPAGGATSIGFNSTISAMFSEAVNSATVTAASFELRDAGNNLVIATINTSSNQITLTPSAALTGSTVYTATIIGGAFGVKDLAGNALAANYSWSFTTVAADITAPTVSAVTPLSGATAVATATTVVANFSEAINSSTVNAGTFQLRDAGSNLVSATISGSSSQFTITPLSTLSNSMVYTATIVGGASGVKDLSGNALAANHSWSFTTAAAPVSSTYTLFQPTDAPQVALAHDGQGIELGMRFRASQDGFISGIRYYKGAGTTGVHIGNLWNSAGTTRLAQATFTTETTSGWQQVLFSSPVAITAGVTYVASFFSPSGDYSATKPYFTQNIINGPLTGLADGLDGGNGLYRYTVTSAFPNSTFQSSNYWVDVVFTTTGITDNTAPTISTVSPANGAIGVSTGPSVTATFSEPVNGATVTASTFQLRDAGNNLVAATISTSNNQIILTPSSPLNGLSGYTATITGGASGVKDLAGNALGANYSWSFSTVLIDIAAPTVSAASPAGGATGVGIGTAVTATFNEAVNPSTVTTSTFQLRDAGNNLIAATVSTTSNQITLSPSSALSNSAVYTAKITGGSSGVKDLSGNALANDYTWSFTTAAPSAQLPVSIQSATTKTGLGALTNSLTAVPAGALLVLATTADANPMDAAVSSSPALTWTKRSDAGASQSDNAEIWTAVFAAGGSINVIANWGADHSQSAVVYVVLNAEPTLGGAAATAVSQAAPSVLINTTRDNSIIFGCSADFNAVNGTTRTLRDAATERLYFRDGNYTTYHYTKGAGLAGAYTEGISLPAGQRSSTALLEIRGVATVATRSSGQSYGITAPVITIANTRMYRHSLGQNFPNPFHTSTTIPFTLAKAEMVNIVLLDISGRLIKVLVSSSKDAGGHNVHFNTGSLASGIYYYKIQAGNFVAVKKLTIH